MLRDGRAGRINRREPGARDFGGSPESTDRWMPGRARAPFRDRRTGTGMVPPALGVADPGSGVVLARAFGEAAGPGRCRSPPRVRRRRTSSRQAGPSGGGETRSGDGAEPRAELIRADVGSSLVKRGPNRLRRPEPPGGHCGRTEDVGAHLVEARPGGRAATRDGAGPYLGRRGGGSPVVRRPSRADAPRLGRPAERPSVRGEPAAGVGVTWTDADRPGRQGRQGRQGRPSGSRPEWTLRPPGGRRVAGSHPEGVGLRLDRADRPGG